MEVLADESSGMYLVELFYPGDASMPVIRTKPVYVSPEEAQQRVREAVFALFEDRLSVKQP
jgi:hypothetical protein